MMRYYMRILSTHGRRQGSPTVDEARRDFMRMLDAQISAYTAP